MAAISGMLRFDGAPTAAGFVRHMAGRMVHRSPHGTQLFDGGACAVAFGALHAAPQSHLEVQPETLPDGARLVVDGRIDDREALARALGIANAELDAIGNARLFAQAWLHWREELWRHVLGDYALAVWEPARAQLTLVRDRIGVRPLYWARTPRLLAFASEAEALLAIDGIPSAPNPDRVASNLVPIFDDGDRSATLYRDVRRLMPGELLEAQSSGRVSLRRYWSFGPLEPLKLGSHADYVAAFREVFDDAVRVRLRAPTTPALMLSGGIDSAAVHASALAQGLPLRRVSVVANQPGAEEERANIEALLAQSPDALRLPVPGVEAVVDLPALAREVFEHAHPVRNSITLPMLVNLAAAASGSRVMLDGIDGDLATSAPNNYVGRMALAGRPLAAWREARAASKTHTYLRGQSAARIYSAGIAHRLEREWMARWRYRLSDARAGGRPFVGTLHPDRVMALKMRQRVLAQRLALRADPMLRDWTGYRHYVWTNPGLMRGMEGFDLAAARFGVEARHPWSDMRVLEFFLRVPMDVVVRDGWTKHVARTAYAPELGPVAWHSDKRHLGPQVTRTVLEAGRENVTAALADDDGVVAGWFDAAMLARARQGWAAGTADLGNNDLAMEISTLQRWLVGLSQNTDPSRAANYPP